MVIACSAIANAQITTKIEQVFVNNQTTVTSCNTIDFGVNANNNLVFYFKLSKSANYVVQDGNLKIKLKYDSSSNGVERGNLTIPASFWSDIDYVHTIPTNISANEIQVNGSSIYLEFTQVSNTNINFNSCAYPITKTPIPTFTLSPTTLSIPCGSVAPVTFSYSNVYNTPGVTYNYSYSGWTFVSQTSNTITLKPTNGNILPSNFSLVPIVNGVTQPYKVCTVTRAPFTTTSAITGGGIICPGATATFNLTDSGSFSNVTWSIPEIGVSTILSSTNSSVTIQAMASETFTINAVVENACGQTQTITKTFNIGVPDVNPFYNTISGLYDNYFTNYSPFEIGVYPIANATSYIWTITGSSTPTTCANRPKFLNGSATMTTYSNYATINIGNCEGNYVVSCRPANACGQSFGIQSRGFTVGNNSDSDNPCDNGPIELIMKNPIKENDGILLNIHHSQLPCDPLNNLKIAKPFTKEEVENIEYSIDICDFYGRKLISRKEKTNKIIISNLNLSKGKYIINISNNLGHVKREILIVE